MTKRSFEIIEEGTHYRLPEYEVIDGQGIKLTEGKKAGNGEFYEVPTPIEIRFVRGSKLKDEEVPKRKGTLHEHLLSMMIHDLKFKNGLVPSRETSTAITKLEEGLHWLEEREKAREAAGVIGTYKKH